MKDQLKVLTNTSLTRKHNVKSKIKLEESDVYYSSNSNKNENYKNQRAYQK